jgi:type-F conjugative transfer system pilin assembly protein TrbC
MLLDPRLFKTYNITQVPTFVVTHPIVSECEGSFCIPTAPEHLKLSGAVHVEWALEQFIREPSSLKSIATNHLNFYKGNNDD